MKLLVTTFRAVLRVELDERPAPTAVELIESTHGIYFGLARSGGATYVVARNRDPDGRVPDPSLGVNNIKVFRGEVRACGSESAGGGASGGGNGGGAAETWTHPEFLDLHQIRHRDGLLWVLSCRPPELLAVDPAARRVVGGVRLCDLVPPELRREAPPQHPTDRYHFNSLHFSGDRLWVLAHNWNEGSFALGLRYTSPARLLESPEAVAVRTGLGRMSHDLFAEGDVLYTLDSGGGRLLASDGRTAPVTPPGSEPHFPRGLAVTDRHFIVASGAWSSEREHRNTGETWLTILDRDTLERRAQFGIGPFGNSCEVCVIDDG
jgi:hypothetical protein